MYNERLITPKCKYKEPVFFRLRSSQRWCPFKPSPGKAPVVYKGADMLAFGYDKVADFEEVKELKPVPEVKPAVLNYYEMMRASDEKCIDLKQEVRNLKDLVDRQRVQIAEFTRQRQAAKQSDYFAALQSLENAAFAIQCAKKNLGNQHNLG